jgi:hypothetical protein
MKRSPLPHPYAAEPAGVSNASREQVVGTRLDKSRLDKSRLDDAERSS